MMRSGSAAAGTSGAGESLRLSARALEYQRCARALPAGASEDPWAQEQRSAGVARCACPAMVIDSVRVVVVLFKQ